MVTLMEFHGYLYPRLTRINPRLKPYRNQEGNQEGNQAIYQGTIFPTETHRQYGTVSRPFVGRADPPPHGFPSLAPRSVGAPLGTGRLRRSSQRDSVCSCDWRLSTSGHTPDRAKASRSCRLCRDVSIMV